MERKLNEAREGEFERMAVQKLAQLGIEHEMLDTQLKLLARRDPLVLHGRDILRLETIPYAAEVKVSATALEVVREYTREVDVKQKYQQLDIRLQIPNTGKNAAGRARIILFFNDKPVADCSINHAAAGPFVPIMLEATVPDVEPSKYPITVQACVDGGDLLMPMFEAAKLDGTIAPKLFGTYLVTGSY